MLDSMEDLIQDHGMLPWGSTVLCAVSGGADSMCLLHRLYHLRQKLDIRVCAAHYNHTLRGEESDRDEEFVREFVSLCCGPERVRDEAGAEQRVPGVELYVGRGDVAGEAKRLGRGLEETARDMRYAFLRETAQKVGADCIAVAHTADDNAETVLLHLVRGTGLQGLGGITPLRGAVIRPLLSTTRREVEDYLRYYGLPWMEDSSNRDEAFTRNRIRSKVIPELEDICPGFRARMADTAARLRADEECLSTLAAEALSAAKGSGERLELPAKAVADLPGPLAVRAARQLMVRMRAGDDRCTAAHLETLVSLSRSADPSARVDLPGGLTARREYELLVLTREEPKPLTGRISLEMPGETLAGEYCLTCQEVVYQGETQGTEEFFLSQAKADRIVVRGRETGDTLRRPGRPGKSVKKLLIDEKIPQNRRDGLPVLEVSDRVAAVAGLGPDTEFLPKAGEQAWHITVTPLREPGV